MKIIEDYRAFLGGSNSIAKKISTVLLNPCFHSVLLFRLSNLFYILRLSPVSKIIWYISRLLFHVDIDYRAKLAGGLKIVHGLGLVIGKNVQSKGNLTLYQGVTIGGSGRERQIGGVIIDMPILEKNVTVYTDAKVFGPVIISEGSIIKAGVIITSDYEENIDRIEVELYEGKN